MSDDGTLSRGRDEILGEFVSQLDETDDPQSVVAAYCQRYPELADELRKMAAMHNRLVAATDSQGEAPPTRLGDFRLGREIARGGMGVIFEAVQEPLGRKVAVKVIRQKKVSSAARDRFLREQQVLARLHQSHIVPIFAAGSDGSQQYFAMPYVRGVALHRLVGAALQQATTHPNDATPPLSDLAQAELDRRESALTPAESASETSATAARPDTCKTGRSSLRRDKESPPAIILSDAYFRSVAQVMADAAQAVQHAHDVGILHRDLKPSNMMVDTRGHCWIIDFGLAGFVGGNDENATSHASPISSTEPPSISEFMGTYQYMAPEQYRLRADHRADIWGLGVTLYELLALRRAFDGESRETLKAKICSGSPVGLKQLVPGVPNDLAKICAMAMQIEPAERYQTAGDLCNDLNNWLESRPTIANPPSVSRRLRMWVRRNKAWASAIGLSLCALILFALFAAARAREAETRAELAETKAEVQTAKADVAEATAEIERAKRREAEFAVTMERMQQFRLTTHLLGWSGRVWDDVVDAAADADTADAPRRYTLASHAAATLCGLDADRPTELEFYGFTVAFSPDGHRLLFGGINDHPAWLYDIETAEVRKSERNGDGPAVFTGDGTPFHLAVTSTTTLVLWNMEKQENVREFQVPARDGLELHNRFANSGSRLPTVAFDAGCRSVAAVTGRRIGTANEHSRTRAESVVVWDVRTGDLLFEHKTNASSLTIGPDGKLLAIGTAAGDIELLSIPDGEHQGTLPNGRTAVYTIAFAPSMHRNSADTPASGGNWLLAAGDSGGLVTIWDLSRKMLVSHCRGTSFRVHSVAFSPDSATLASCGRESANLWDVKTGRHLLRLGTADISPGIAFSPDGHRLATSRTRAWDYQHAARFWELEKHRGIRQLQGLSGTPMRITFSPDGTLVAAFSASWEVGIWNVESGSLLHVLGVPEGIAINNLDMAFSHDSKLFAFSAGETAMLWDISTGQLQQRWPLPRGLQDALAFDSDGNLLLMRFDLPVEKTGKGSCPLRVLRGPDARETPVKVIDDFTEGIEHIRVSPNAEVFVAHDGRHYPGEVSRVYDAHTGDALWSVKEEVWPRFSPDGRSLAIASGGLVNIYDAITGDILEQQQTDQLRKVTAFNSQYVLSWNSTSVPALGYMLYALDGAEALLALGIDTPANAMCEPKFSPDQRHVAWGNLDGSITLVDIPEVRRRLNEIGLGW